MSHEASKANDSVHANAKRKKTIMAIAKLFAFQANAIINILQEIIKILQEKMLKAINLYWFHNDASEKNNSLNDRSNKTGLNG